MIARGILILFFAMALATASISLAQDQAQPKSDRGIWIESNELIVIVPQTRATIAAYSIRNDKWDHVALPEPLTADEQVVVSNSIAAFRAADCVYGFTAGGATWSRQKVSSSKSAVPVLSSRMVKVSDGDMLLVMGENSKEWSGASLIDGGSLPTDESEPE